MPVHKTTKGGKTGYKYGSTGKFYPGKAGKAKAHKQAKAIESRTGKKCRK